MSLHLITTLPKLDNHNENFTYWWNKQGEWVEAPNERRGGFSGVIKTLNKQGEILYIKKQEGHIYHSLLYPFGQATIRREYNAYLAFNKAKVRTPQVIYCGQLGKKAILVTKALANFISFEEWLSNARQANTKAATISAVLDSIANMLVQLHKNHLQHNCIYSKHIFVNVLERQKVTVHTALLDLEKSRKRLTAKQAALHDTPQIRRHSAISHTEWLYFAKQYEMYFGSPLPKLYQLPPTPLYLNTQTLYQHPKIID